MWVTFGKSMYLEIDLLLKELQGTRDTLYIKISLKPLRGLLLLFIFMLFYLRYYIYNAWKTYS